MSKHIYVCRVIGDGSSEDSYRTAIRDIIDPQTGTAAFSVVDVIGDDNGSPSYPWAVAIVSGARQSLARDHADVDAVCDPAVLGLAISTSPVEERNPVLASLTARGIDLSQFDIQRSWRALVEHLIHLHQPTYDINDFDVAG